MVCVPVVGPWVQATGAATPTYWQLACPGRGYVVAGIDADRSGRLEITFLGTLGSPVGPGRTTGRAAVFVARTTGGLAAFRPRLGCIPGGGGGARGRTSYTPGRRLTAAAPPAEEAAIRRVKTVAVPNRASVTATHRCLEGERLLASSQAIAFRSSRPPARETLGSVRASARRSGGRVVATARSSVDRPVGLRVQMQVHAICARTAP
jgi:hypothetical protein